MKNVAEKKSFGTVLLVAVAMGFMFLLPEISMAAGNVNTVLTNNRFMPIIKFGLGLYAAWKWFEYFSNFSPGSAFRDIIVPAIITYLAFEIQTVLGFFGLNSL